jgi:hypothetical protein
MREITHYKRGFLRAIEKRGGELVMRGKHAHRTLDYWWKQDICIVAQPLWIWSYMF